MAEGGLGVKILERIDNDTLVILGMIAVALVYSVTGTGEQIVNSIVSAFGGFIGGQYVASRPKAG